MKIYIEDICIDLSNNHKKIGDEIEFLKQNYNTIYMGKYFYASYKDLKIEAEFMIDDVFKK
jgi:hypothetical protein